MDIFKLVNDTVKKYGTRNPFELVACLDCIILTVPLKGINGFYQHYKRNDIIYLNETLSDCDKKIVCAHELAHCLIDKNVNSIYLNNTLLLKSKYEIRADLFAAHLLITDNDVLNNKLLTTSQLSQLLEVSEYLVNLKIEAMNLNNLAL